MSNNLLRVEDEVEATETGQDTGERWDKDAT